MADTASSRLIIIGAGGFGRELLGWIRKYALPFDFVGFLDNLKSGENILGTIEGHQPQLGAFYISALGAPADRHMATSRIENAGGRFVNIMSPNAMLASTLPPNAGIIALGDASAANDVKIGRHVLLQTFCAIGHDVTVGDYSTVSSFAFIGGKARIGALVTIHPHATILPSVVVGDGAVIGAGSVVTRNVAANTTVFGNPAKLLMRAPH